MRFVLALLAVLALLVSPVTAAAAGAACGQNGLPQMVGMGMSAPPCADQADVHKAVDPCCGHADQHKMGDKSCAQACATSCAVVAALPSSLASLNLTVTRVPVTLARLISVKGYKPAGPERPPKSNA